MAKRPALGMVEFVLLFALVNCLVALGLDALLPAMRMLEGALNVSDPNRIQLVIPIFILGAVFGEIIAGPLADAYGRKVVILVGLVIFCLGSIISMQASSLDQLLLGRIIQGFGVSGPKIASRAMIRDQYSGDAMARIMSFIFMIFILVPMIAPAIGQWAIGIAGWQAIFVMYLVTAGSGFIWLGLRQGETLPPEKKLPISPATLAANIGLIVRNKQVVAYTISVGFVFGGVLNYLGTAQAIFFDVYDIDKQFPLYYAILAGGIGLAFFANSQLVTRYGMHRLAFMALWGSIFFSLIMLFAAILYSGSPPFSLFMACGFCIFFCNGFLFGNLNTMAMDLMGRVAGLGASVVSSCSSLIGVGIALTIGPFYDQSVIPLYFGFLISGLVGVTLLTLSARLERAEV